MRFYGYYAVIKLDITKYQADNSVFLEHHLLKKKKTN